jgi:hypothetical protein
MHANAAAWSPAFKVNNAIMDVGANIFVTVMIDNSLHTGIV